MFQDKGKSQSLDEQFLFHPAKFPAGEWKPAGLSFEDVTVTTKDNVKVHAWFSPVEKPRAVVLFAHGNAGNLSHRAYRLRYFQKDLQVTSMIFDYRGYGKSEGKPTVEGVLLDARAARTELARKAGVPEKDVVLMGESLGGAVAVDLAADGARGLVLENTFSSFKDVAHHHAPLMSWLVPGKKLNSVETIKKYLGPLLQTHGDADSIIPFKLGKKLHEAAPGKKELFVISGGDHNDGPTKEYLEKLNEFITSLGK